MSRFRLLPVLAMLAIAACAGPPRTAEPSAQTLARLAQLRAHDCTPAIASAVEGQRIAPASVTGLIVTEERIDAGEIDDVIGYLAWMRLDGQPGYLIVSLDEYCHVRQVYTRGGAELPGVPSYSW
jgi:hypothetical protein